MNPFNFKRILLNICLEYPVHLFKYGVAELGAWEVLYFVGPEEIVYSFFNFFPDTFWNSIYLTVYHSLDQRIWFMVIFYPLKESCILFQIWIFPVKLSYILSQFLLSWAELWKFTPTILMENCDQAICLGLSILFLYATPHKVWLFEKLIFELEAFWDNSKINSVLVKQLKSLKKMVVSSAKFTILISWSPICIPLILVSASMKIASTSATIIHNNIESGQPWWNPWMRVKESDRRPFILILDWILMEATWIMWMNLFL